MELFNLFIKTVFVENMVLAFFLGMCSYLAVSKKVETALGLGLAVTFVQVITVPTNWAIYHYLLDPRTNIFGSNFVFNNPKAKSSCGCGTSFSI